MKFNIRGHGWYSSPNLNGPQSSLSLSQNPDFLGQSGGPPDHPKEPLLSLTLSTPSFLECTIIDVATTYLLYRMKTTGTTTTVTRSESLSSSVVASSIKWPKIIPLRRTKARSEPVLVEMRDGPWRGGNSLLKPGSRDAHARTFRLPNHDNPMKWQLHGNLYWCTTPSVLGAIATLDPRRGDRPPRLTVYEDLRDKCKPHQPVYEGVSIQLLDYLVVTALLFVTDPQEWALVQRPSYSEFPRSDQAEFGSTTKVWKEEAVYPMPSHPLEASLESPSSMASMTGPSWRNRRAVLGSSHAHNPPSPHSLVGTDSDSENDHESQWRRTPSSVSEALPPESSHPLHRLTFRIRGSAFSSGTQTPDGSKPPPPIRDSIIADDIQRNVLPSMLQIIHPFQAMELDSDQHSSDITPKISAANSLGNRPLPLPPVADSPDKSSAGSSRELGEPSPPSQHRSARILPPIPYASRHTRSISDVHPTPLDGPPSQYLYTRDDVYNHQSITKASREGVAQWLNSLSGGSPTTENALDLLLGASIFDAPPPAYNSLRFSLDQRHGREPVSSSNSPGDSEVIQTSEWQG